MTDQPNDSDEQFEARLRGLLTPAASAERVRARIEQSVGVPATPRKRFGVLDAVVIAASIAICAAIGLRLLPARPAVTPTVGAETDVPPLTAEEKTRFTALVEDLKSEDFDKREAAFRELSAADERLLPLLAEIKTDDADLKQRVKQLREKIETLAAHKQAIARLDAYEAGLATTLGNKIVSERQKAAIAWATAGDRPAKVRLLVEVFPKVDYGPLLHGCSEALNVLTAEEPFMARSGMSWAGDDGETVHKIIDQAYPGVHFSAVTRAACENTRCPPIYNSNSGFRLLADMLENLPATFCFEAKGKLQILNRQEAAAYWTSWWASAQKQPEWQRDISTPTAENIALWTKELDGNDAQAILRSHCRLLDAWDNEQGGARAAIETLAKGATPGAERARALMTLRELRDAGTVYFNAEIFRDKMTVYTMRPDGSGAQPLFPQNIGTRTWWLMGERDGWLLLEDFGKDTDYLWRPGMAAPEQFTSKGGVLGALPGQPGAWLVVTSEPTRALFVFDPATRQRTPFVDAAGNALIPPNAKSLKLAPDQKRLVYSLPAGNTDKVENYAIWIVDLERRVSRELLPAEAGRGLHNYRVEWSPDSVWLTCKGAITANGEYRGYFWLIDTATGQRQNLAEGYRCCSSSVWDRNEPKLYFVRDTAPHANSLWAWQLGGLRELPHTPEMREAIKSHNVNLSMHVDGRVRYAAESSFLVDPTGKMPVEQTSEEWTSYCGPLNFGNQRWELAESEAVPGAFARQIVLISPDGKRMVPLTNMKGGCSSPIFVPARR